MKKRILAAFMAAVMCALLCACGEQKTKTESGPSIKDQAITLAEREVRSKVSNKYDASGGIGCETAAVNEVKDNVFDISGKVYVKNKYGDISWAKYDVHVTYYEPIGDETRGRFSTVTNVGTLK